MTKTIKKLRKKLKLAKKLNIKLDNEIIEYHNDIIVLDQTNFQLEKENSALHKKISDYEEVYLKDTKSAFEKQLEHIMTEARDIKKESNTFYADALKYLYGYIQALEKYSNGDTKEIMKKIQYYKNKVHDTQKSLQEIKCSKKSLFKKIDKAFSDMMVFRKKLDANI